MSISRKGKSLTRPAAVEHDPQGKPRITLQKIQIERLLYIVILCATLTFFEVKPWLVRQWACA